MLHRSVLLLALAGCTAELPQSKLILSKSTTEKLTILATGDVGSDTDVCGCKARQMGGLARRAKVMKERAGARSIAIDAGDLFFRNWSVAPRQEAQAIATAEFLADSAKQMGIAALAVGERDLALGVPRLKKLGERGGIALLSANLIYTGSSTSAFEAFTVIEEKGMKVGIVGASPELGPKSQAHLVYEREKLSTKPLLESVLSAAKAARAAGADTVIALLHVGQASAVDLLNKLPPGTIDVALVSHDRLSGNLTLLPEGRSAWMSTGSRGKWLVAIDLEVVKGATGLMDVGALEAQKRAITAIDLRLEAYERADAGSPDPTIAKQISEERLATMGRLKKRRQQLQAELDGLSLAGKHLVSGEMIPLDVALPDDEEMLAKYRVFQDRLIEVNSGGPVPNRADIEYTGSAACKACHAPMQKQWEKTKHAKAWETMIRTRQTGNLDCIPCHVTGFDRPGGPAGLLGIEKFVNVGCESCHGPGSAHVKNPKLEMDYGKIVPEKVCAECHRVQEDQKHFDYEERLPKVRH